MDCGTSLIARHAAYRYRPALTIQRKTFMFRTPAFENFVAPAAAYPSLWRLTAGVVVAILTYMVPILGAFVLVGVFFPERVWELQSSLETSDTPSAMFILLATFIFMGLAAIAAAGCHRRGLASLIGPFRPACRNFSRAILACAGVYLVVGYVSSLFMADSPIAHLDLATWAGYLPLALPLLLVQTGSEELIFRGYLMQALAARFRSAWVWMGIPTVLFGLAHWNPAVDPIITVLFVLATGLFGLIAADLTRVTGNLGAAMGFHFANNFFALFLVAIAGEMSGLALYHTTFTMDDVDILVPLLIIDMFTVVGVWLMLRRWLTPD